MALPLGAKILPSPADYFSAVQLLGALAVGACSFTKSSSVEAVRELTLLYLGRSVAACTETFKLLRARLVSAYPASYQPAGRPDYQAPTPKPKKRPVPSADVSTTADRTIQPRVSSFAAVNEPNDPPAFPSASANTGEPPNKKKRGRPSKAEHEIRAAEAAARGEPYPPPKKTRTPRQSAEGAAPMANMFTPVPAGPGGMGESSTGRKPARPKRPKQTAARNQSLEATAHAADQMRTEMGEAMGSTVLETLTPTQPGPENLISELQEHAAIPEPARPAEPEAMDTGESSGALEQHNEQQQEQQQGHRREQQPEQRLETEYRVYEAHQQTPTV